jgi:two-component sensor histidine kinase
MTNAMQHAFVGREAGVVEMRLKALSNGTLRLQISDDGVGLPPGATWPDEGSLGGRIVSQLVEALDAGLSVARGSAGTIISVDVPPHAEV